jgi:hypothetical protein
VPRKRKASRTFTGNPDIAPRSAKAARVWWVRRLSVEAQAGRLPLRIPRGSVTALMGAVEALGANRAAVLAWQAAEWSR